MISRLVVALLIGLTAGSLANSTHSHHTLASPTQDRPYVYSAELSGNNLFVEGVNFDENTTVYINFKRRDTILDVDSHGTVLKVKKGGKRIRIDEANLLFVANGDGQTSNYIRLFRTEEFVARLVQFPWQPELGFIQLKVGGLLLVDSRGMQSTDTYDQSLLMRTEDRLFDTDGLRLYQVLRDGDTGFEIAQAPFTDAGPPPPPIIWRMAIHADRELSN